MTTNGRRWSVWELIALIFAATFALVVFTATVGAVILIQDASDPPTSHILSAIGTATSTMLGALIVLASRREQERTHDE